MTTLETAGQLSPSEIDFIPEAANRSKWDAIAERRRAAANAARSVLRAEMIDLSWNQLMRDPTRGEVAARLYATWLDVDRPEPIIETDYSVTGIYADLTAAMKAHGLGTFDERCAELGKRMVEAAIAYILASHETDYEAITEEWNASVRTRDDEEADRAEAYYINRGIDP